MSVNLYVSVRVCCVDIQLRVCVCDKMTKL